MDTVARMSAVLFRPHADAMSYLSDDMWDVVEDEVGRTWVTLAKS